MRDIVFNSKPQETVSIGLKICTQCPKTDKLWGLIKPIETYIDYFWKYHIIDELIKFLQHDLVNSLGALILMALINCCVQRFKLQNITYGNSTSRVHADSDSDAVIDSRRVLHLGENLGGGQWNQEICRRLGEESKNVFTSYIFGIFRYTMEKIGLTFHEP